MPTGEFVIGALAVLRSMCNPVAPGKAPATSARIWLAEVENPSAGGEHPPVAVSMQVTAPSAAGSHVVGVEATTLVIRTDGASFDTSTPAARDALLGRLWPACAHVLWDYCALHMRLLTSGLMVPGVDLPTVTPQPDLVFDADLTA